MTPSLTSLNNSKYDVCLSDAEHAMLVRSINDHGLQFRNALGAYMAYYLELQTNMDFVICVAYRAELPAELHPYVAGMANTKDFSSQIPITLKKVVQKHQATIEQKLLDVTYKDLKLYFEKHKSVLIQRLPIASLTNYAILVIPSAKGSDLHPLVQKTIEQYSLLNFRIHSSLASGDKIGTCDTVARSAHRSRNQVGIS